MFRFSWIITAVVFSLTSYSQVLKSDVIGSGGSAIRIQPVFHGGFVMNWQGKKIFVDPYENANAYAGKPDVVIITDIHPDHLDTAVLFHLDLGKATLVVPEAVKDRLPEKLKSKAVVLHNGDSAKLAGVGIKALPMYNLPETEDSKHPKGRGNGYVLDLNKVRIYVSGDTEDIPEMRALKNIDVAFVCMNLPYTMDVQQASDAVLAFKPKVVYPYHYRGKDGYSDVQLFNKLVKDKNPSIDVRLRDWYAGKQ